MPKFTGQRRLGDLPQWRGLDQEGWSHGKALEDPPLLGCKRNAYQTPGASVTSLFRGANVHYSCFGNLFPQLQQHIRTTTRGITVPGTARKACFRAVSHVFSAAMSANCVVSRRCKDCSRRGSAPAECTVETAWVVIPSWSAWSSVA